MSLALAVMILLIVLVVAALAVFLIATIVQLVKINRGLAVVIASVGEIVAKTAPVNGVLDAINGTLITGRNLLEGLFLKKAGDDAGGLVESCFPGEGPRFLGRVGRSGPVHNIGPTYPRGAAILASLLGTPAPAQEAAPPPAHATPEGRIRLRPRSAPMTAPLPPSAPAREQAAEAPSSPGRLSARGGRPWESAAPMTAAPPPPPPPAPRGGPAQPPEPASAPGRLSGRGSRPWESATEPASAPGRLSARGGRPWESATPMTAAPPPPPPPAPRGGPAQPPEPASAPGRLSGRGSRPWER